MEAFKTYRGKIATLNRANVDTDQIIPKQFLKSISRTGFGEALFFDWRYGPDGKPDPNFPLNAPRFAGAGILVTRNNFGCGSSREHAVWAVRQAGFRVVIAPRVERDGAVVPGFADIFRNNSFKNGLLAIELSEAEVDKLFELTDRFEGLEATVDLEAQQITLHTGGEAVSFHFEIDPVVREHLLAGQDEIALTLEYEQTIAEFEQRHDPQLVMKATDAE